MVGWRTLLLDIGDDLTGIGLVPAPVELLGGEPKLDDEVAGEVLRLDLAALLSPQPQQSGFIIAHDDPGVRAADESCVSSVEFGLPSFRVRPSNSPTAHLAKLQFIITKTAICNDNISIRIPQLKSEH